MFKFFIFHSPPLCIIVARSPIAIHWLILISSSLWNKSDYLNVKFYKLSNLHKSSPLVDNMRLLLLPLLSSFFFKSFWNINCWTKFNYIVIIVILIRYFRSETLLNITLVNNRFPLIIQTFPNSSSIYCSKYNNNFKLIIS